MHLNVKSIFGINISMTIKTISTFLKVSYIPENLHDTRANSTHMPPHVVTKLRQWTDEGKYPSTRQPGDSVVVTDEHIIITTVWFDEAAAQEWVDMGLAANIPELVD